MTKAIELAVERCKAAGEARRQHLDLAFHCGQAWPAVRRIDVFEQMAVIRVGVGAFHFLEDARSFFPGITERPRAEALLRPVSIKHIRQRLRSGLLL